MSQIDRSPGGSAARISLIMSSLSTQRIVDFVSHLDAVLPSEDIELVVATPAKVPKLPRTVVIPEPVRLGNIGASRLASEFCSGDIMVGMSDDNRIIDPQAFMQIRRMIYEREKTWFPFCFGFPLMDNKFGTVYGYYYANFPAMSRKSVEAIGGWFDPLFKCGAADTDMSLRVWNAGGRVEVIGEKIISTDNIPSTYSESRHSFADPQVDIDSLVARWNEIYGEGFRYKSVFGNIAPQKIIVHYPNDWLDGNSFARNIPPWRMYLMRLALSRSDFRYVVRLMVKWVKNCSVRAVVRLSSPEFRAVLKKSLE